MTRHLPPAIALFFASLATVSAQAQYVGGDLSFGAMMMNQNIGNAATYQNNMNRLDEERQELNKQRSPSTSAKTTKPVKPSSDILGKTRDAALAELGPEYQRRQASMGKPQADAWVRSAMSSVGNQIGALHPQYLQRLQRDGQPSADGWYIAQAHVIGQRQVNVGR